MKKYIALLFCTALLLPVNLNAAQGQCQMALLATITPLVDDNGGILVPVVFEGREAWMHLAMNQGLPFLFHGAVSELGLESRLKATEWIVVIGGKRIQSQVTAESVALGNANFRNWNLLIRPDTGSPLQMRAGKPVIGILTSTFMNAVDVEFDLAANQIRLFRQKNCKGPPVHWEGEVTSAPLHVDTSGLMMFAVELDGKKVEASLNTANRQSVLSSRVSKDHFGFDENSPEIQTQSADGEDVKFHAMSLTASGLNIRNHPIRLRTGDTCKISAARSAKTGSRVSAARESGSIGYSNCVSATPLSIGTNILKQLRVYMASKEGRIYFQSAGGGAGNAAVPPGRAPTTP